MNKAKKKIRKYIHYGQTEFNPLLMFDHLEKMYSREDKPHGLWSSPVNADRGWKDWCESEDFYTESLNKSFTFSLRANAKILQIKKLEDALPYMVETERFGSLINYKLNLKRIYAEFDGMEVWMSKDWNNLHDNNVFYTWDVDSLVVWNPAVIERSGR